MPLIEAEQLPRRPVAVVLGTLPVRLVASGWPPPGWVVVACAVGQGDALVLPVSAGRAVVVDAGPDPAAVDGCLRRLGVREIPLLVVSHFDVDHVGGVTGVFRGRRVAAVQTPAWAEPVTGLHLIRTAASAGGAEIGAATVGWTYRAGAVELVVRGPVYPSGAPVPMRTTTRSCCSPQSPGYASCCPVTPRRRSSGRCWTAPRPVRSAPTC
ncbi:MBL fold metallo-hydrolase [Micromonospora sp. ATA32]|nr:MBL fold metallo-hydrolase [Micromonospora sp. ATA32]